MKPHDDESLLLSLPLGGGNEGTIRELDRFVTYEQGTIEVTIHAKLNSTDFIRSDDQGTNAGTNPPRGRYTL
jgi:hypothetical protein